MILTILIFIYINEKRNVLNIEKVLYFLFISVYWIKGYIGIYICNINVDIESIGWIIYWILW